MMAFTTEQLDELNAHQPDAAAEIMRLRSELDGTRRQRDDWKAAHAQAVERAGSARVVEIPSERTLTLMDVRQPSRTATDYAIEHARYLVDAARAYMDASEAVERERAAHEEAEEGEAAAAASDILDGAEEQRGEAWSGLRNAIYEFEKRRDRALAADVESNERSPGTASPLEHATRLLRSLREEIEPVSGETAALCGAVDFFLQTGEVPDNVKATDDVEPVVSRPATTGGALITYWLGQARNKNYSLAERLLFMENAFNHSENARIAADRALDVPPKMECQHEWEHGDVVGKGIPVRVCNKCRAVELDDAPKVGDPS